jgi:hypothetical protein
MLNDFEVIPRMNPLLCRSLLSWCAFAFASALPVFAETAAPAEVEVTAIKFNPIRQANSQSVWYEGAIELTAKPTPENGKFTGRVKVALNVGIEAPLPGGKKQINIYRASAELIALEAGKSEVRFYLPPEIVKRDSIKEAKYYFAEVGVGGKPIPPTKASVSFATLGSPAVLESFRAKVASDGASNDGIMLPQYLTPYMFDSSRPTPSFVRVENTH